MPAVLQGPEWVLRDRDLSVFPHQGPHEENMGRLASWKTGGYESSRWGEMRKEGVMSMMFPRTLLWREGEEERGEVGDGSGPGWGCAIRRGCMLVGVAGFCADMQEAGGSSGALYMIQRKMEEQLA